MEVVETVRAEMLTHFGVETDNVDSASVTFLGLEPLEIVRFAVGDLVHYVTVGGSRNPMGDPADLLADPIRGPRAELILTQHVGFGVIQGLARTLGVLAAAPAVEGVVLRIDALLDLSEPIWAGAPFTAVLLGDSGIPEITLPDPADPVRYLEVVPVTATEAAWVRLRGAQALRDAWAEADIDVHNPNRGAAAL